MMQHKLMRLLKHTRLTCRLLLLVLVRLLLVLM
jgi:hypothetical protein